MSDERSEILALLRKIRDQQRQQLPHAEEALRLHREQFALVQRQAERAEKLQDRSAQVVSLSRRLLGLVLPVIAVLVVHMSWLLFGRHF